MPHVRHAASTKRGAHSALLAVAAQQHGRISTRQLLDLGLTRAMVAGRVRSGLLVPEQRGAYRLAGAPTSLEARCAAAILGVDPTAVLTARTGLELRGVLEPLSDPAVHLACAHHHRARPGVVVHRRPVKPETVERVEGLRVAPVSRCLTDLATYANPAQIAEAVHEAEFRRLLDASSLLAEATVRRGSPLLRELARERLPISGNLRLALEHRFAELLRTHGFPTAEVNRRLVLRDPHQVVYLDVVWLPAGLAVELDGRQAHATAKAFDADRARDRRLLTQYGLQVVRATWKHVVEDGDALAADLRALHARGLAARTTAES